jgi:DNA invertase Pin-like site-specific DNA recombinase
MTEPTVTPALGSIRLSRMSDDTTSPERQRADLLRQPGVSYVDVVEDLDVSATKYGPTERPKLGPWLTEPKKLALYDELIVWKLDRFCRKARDMRDMMGWSDETGKRLVFQQDRLVYDPRAEGLGKVMNDVMIALVAAFAEMESLNTSEKLGLGKAGYRLTDT